MRFIGLIAIGISCLVVASCGGSSTEEETKHPAHAAASIRDTAKAPKVRLPAGPSPKQLVVKDIRVGHGAAIPPKGSVQIKSNFVSVSYRTGKPLEVHWSPAGAFNIGFGPGLEIKGWERGLVGMKVGGRRELLVPSRLAYKEGALLYVVDLLGVR